MRVLITVSISALIFITGLPKIGYSATLLPTLSETGVTTDNDMFSLPTAEITSPLITDNDINTGVVLYGQDGSVDYGAFAKVLFNVDSDIDSLTLNMSVSSNNPNFSAVPNENVAFQVWNYSTNHYAEFHTSGRGNADISDGIDSFSITFTSEGHNGNSNSLFKDARLNDIIGPDGSVSFLAYGPFFWSSSNTSGFPELYLNEINIVTTVVPLPLSSMLFVTGGVLLTGLCRIKRKKNA